MQQPAAQSSAVSAEEDLTLYDVYRDESKMQAFIGQLTVEELVRIAGSYGNESATVRGAICALGAGSGSGLDQYGIPAANAVDGPAGIVLHGGRPDSQTTFFPCESLLACSWDTALAEELGLRLGTEASALGMDVWLAPGVNLHRNPLTGRNFEYYSEDPLLSGKFAAAVARGAAETGVQVMLKHFVCNEKEASRDISDSILSERALRELYLKPFRIAIEEGEINFVMNSYNLVNGVETSENWELNVGILREEWGFEGAIVTDWANNSLNHKEILGGTNIKTLNPDPDDIYEALNRGELTIDGLRENAKFILNALMHVNSFTKLQTIFEEGDSVLEASQYLYQNGAQVEEKSINDALVRKTLSGFSAGDEVIYTVYVCGGGQFRLFANYRAQTAGKAFTVYVNGEQVASFTVKNTGENFSTTGGYQLQLPEGKAEIKLVFEDTDVTLSALCFDRG